MKLVVSNKMLVKFSMQNIPSLNTQNVGDHFWLGTRPAPALWSPHDSPNLFYSQLQQTEKKNENYRCLKKSFSLPESCPGRAATPEWEIRRATIRAIWKCLARSCRKLKRNNLRRDKKRHQVTEISLDPPCPRFGESPYGHPPTLLLSKNRLRLSPKISKIRKNSDKNNPKNQNRIKTSKK